MSLSDLDRILKKDPIIATWPAQALRDSPERVEKDYATHAKTHLSLGETSRYVDEIFKWVGGTNKGAFVGAVLGEFGQGKTSFMVHVWEQSQSRGVLTVPPFQWDAFEDILVGVGGWASHLLRDHDPMLAKRAWGLVTEFQAQSAEQMAKESASQTGVSYEDALKMARAMIASGQWKKAELSAARVLDFVEKMTELVMEAGYSGLLILLDEPEVAAKALGTEAVSHFFFSLSDELHLRQGNYGVFISLPQTFYASIAARFSSLLARLSVRNCFVRLGDLYGPDFAADLWQRYMEAFDLADKSQAIVEPLALAALGQIGSSARRDLSYGPRTVVSAYNQIVARYSANEMAYTVNALVDDIQSGEIYTRPEYASLIQDALHSPDADAANHGAIKMLAAFPLGMRMDLAEELGLEDELSRLARPGSLVLRTAHAYRLRALSVDSSQDDSFLLQQIQAFDDEFVPSLATFDTALEAFMDNVVPQLFAPRQGQQLLGWESLSDWMNPGRGMRYSAKIGAFAQTQTDYPMRAVVLGLSSVDKSIKDLAIKPPNLDESGPQQYDLAVLLKLRWSPSQPAPAECVVIRRGEPDRKVAALLELALDLTSSTLRHDYLAEQFGQDRITPLWVLYILERMSRIELPKDAEGEWQAVQGQLLRQLPSILFDGELAAQARRTVTERLQGATDVAFSGGNMLGAIALQILRDRHPSYHTLMVAPHWQTRITTYIGALQNNLVPLACKRGNKPWIASDGDAQIVFGTSRMNLTGSAFARLDSLIQITSAGRNEPLQISFKLHPLEKSIMDFIMAGTEDDDAHIQVDGKPCPFVYEADLANELLTIGYTLDEIKMIVDIGEARQSFERRRHHRDDVICCRILDVDLLKSRCLQRLDELVEEIKLLSDLPGYHAPDLDVDLLRSRINAIEDDADCDEILSTLDREFDRDQRLVVASFAELATCIANSYKTLRGYADAFAKSSSARLIAEDPKGTSAWCSALAKYVVSNLRIKAHDLRQSIKVNLDQAGGYHSQYKPRPGMSREQSVCHLVEGWQKNGQLASTVADMQEQGVDVAEQLKHYGEWLQLLHFSDNLYSEILKLGQGGGAQSKCEELLLKFEQVSEEISDHIEVRNLEGLPAYPQYRSALTDIRKELETYRRSINDLFQKRKGAVNNWLQAAYVTERVRTTFDYLDPATSYEALSAEGTRLLHEAGQMFLRELATQQRELSYTADVLGIMPAAERQEVAKELQQRTDALGASLQNTDQAWLRNAMESEDADEARSAVGPLLQARETVDQVRREVAKYRKPQVPEKGEGRETYALVPEQGSADLQQIILSLVENGEEPSLAVESALKGLGELFRRSCVQIQVERRRR